MNTRICSIAAALIVSLLPQTLTAQESRNEAGNDKTLSPYFFVMSEDSNTEQLPLKHTEADVVVAGMIADVEVKQVYQNRGSKPLEAVYVFPASTRAAVYKVTMRIGERLIEAKIKERAQAKAEYQAAKKEGKSASLLEQERPNVFRMNVANIMPGDEIAVELSYAEALVPRDGVYEFVYPTVVGPRYSNRPDKSGTSDENPPAEHWVKNPYLKEGESPSYTFGFKAKINAGLPISDITSASHQVSVSYENPTSASIDLLPEEKFGGNRDLVLRYRLAENKIESGALLYEGSEENFFLLMLEPPKRISPADIVPREYIFILDVSGSMYGFPIDTAKTLLKDLVSQLKPTDRFNVLLFAGASELLSPRSLAATSENVATAIRLIDKQQGGGGTELLPALRRGFSLPKEENMSRTVAVITDGYVDVETESFDLVKKNLGASNVFAFGIGSGVNRLLIEGLARAGGGEPFVALNPAEARVRAREFREYIDSPVLSNIKVRYEGFDAYDVSPDGIADLFASKPVIQFGKWRGEAAGKVIVTGQQGDKPFRQELELSAAPKSIDNKALRILWARNKIAELSDYVQVEGNSETVALITNLGLTYNLLTKYTSFIAVDTIVRAFEPGTKAKQPLPLPAGVANSAIGGGVPSVPEPETWALLLVALFSIGISAKLLHPRTAMSRWQE